VLKIIPTKSLFDSHYPVSAALKLAEAMVDLHGAGCLSEQNK